MLKYTTIPITKKRRRLLKIEDISCIRSNNLLFSNLSFSLEKGENLEVIGSNGSGKTSLLRCILGLVERDNGNIFWKEEKIEEARNIFVKSVFYQGHQLSLKNTFSVLENLKFSHSAFNLSEKEILNSLTITGLKDLASMPSSDLSMGQLKKLAISKWLLRDYELYLIDEPFTSLDEEGSNLVVEVINELNSRGCSFLFTSHLSSKVNSKEILLDDFS